MTYDGLIPGIPIKRYDNFIKLYLLEMPNWSALGLVYLYDGCGPIWVRFFHSKKAQYVTWEPRKKLTRRDTWRNSNEISARQLMSGQAFFVYFNKAVRGRLEKLDSKFSGTCVPLWGEWKLKRIPLYLYIPKLH